MKRRSLREISDGARDVALLARFGHSGSNDRNRNNPLTWWAQLGSNQ
jgi:hypothetical protein